MMKRLITILILLSAYALNANYNFLFICVDDLRPELGCYGANYIKSPNIDKLASQARVFTNHYVQVPTCGASRASMLTSKYPYIEDGLSHGFAATHISTLPERENPESFAHLLRRNDYYTVSIGKVSHKYDGYIDSKKTLPEFPYSWDERHLEKANFKDAQKAYENPPKESAKNKKGANYECASNDVKFPDELNTDLAIKKLDELKAKEKPFMLAIGYFKPHLPFNSAKRYWDMYNEEEIEVADLKEFGDIPTAFGHNSGEFNTYDLKERYSLNNLMEDSLARTMRHAYYACVSATDDQIGRLLNALEEKGLADNTVVVLWGDHGWHLGDNAIWGKHSLFRRALNSPLIIKVPNMPQQGVKNDSMVESVDIYPTICDLASIETPKNIDGKSLSSILKEAKESVKDYAISFWKKDQQIAIHTQTESLMCMHMFSPKEITAYFDLSKNAYEVKDISKESPEKSQNLKNKIVDFLKEFNITYPLLKSLNTDQAKKKSKDENKEKSKKKQEG